MTIPYKGQVVVYFPDGGSPIREQGHPAIVQELVVGDKVHLTVFPSFSDLPMRVYNIPWGTTGCDPEHWEECDGE